MKELIFIVEDAPEGGYTARALVLRSSRRPTISQAFTPKCETRCAAISRRTKDPRSSGYTSNRKSEGGRTSEGGRVGRGTLLV